jgi:hypothetical protein
MTKNFEYSVIQDNFTFDKQYIVCQKNLFTMKKLYYLLFTAGFLFLSSLETFAGFWTRTIEHGGGGGGDAVGAPLDGGLLAILAIAGGTYFAARKRKKKEQ